MGELWAVLGALAAVVLPLILAWWHVGRGFGRDALQRPRRGNMRRKEDR